MENTILVLGFFDGVHLGHASLLRKTAELARQTGGRSVAISFDKHPRSLTAHRPVPLLCSAEQRRALIYAQGVDELRLLPFTDELRHVRWRDFAEGYLLSGGHVRAVVMGHDCHFGYLGEGTPELLRALGEEKGFFCEILPPLRQEGIRVSSTYIRGLVAEGDMEKAARFLGRPYNLSGEVRRGDGLGRVFGFPTVNLLLPHERQWPAWGVYATRVTLRGESYGAVTNVGLRPTIQNKGMPTVESTLFGFDECVYGEDASVDFLHFLRPERRFDSVEALKTQVKLDIAEAKNLLGFSEDIR